MLRFDTTSRDAAPWVRRASSSPLLSWAALGCLLLTSACASSTRLTPGTPDFGPYETVHAGAGDPGATASNIETVLRAEVQKWWGTPHVLGGEDRSGLDCSAFVRTVYDDLFDLPLPRTTKEQAQVGQAVSERDLQVGDLVFFQPPTKSRHVGIYLSGGEFAHVSSSDGVTISRLDDRYWRSAYWTSRRLLPTVERPVVQTDYLPAPTETTVFVAGQPPRLSAESAGRRSILPAVPRPGIQIHPDGV